MNRRSAALLEEILSAHGVRCTRLPLADGAYLLATDHGGRIYGPLSDAIDSPDWWPEPDELSRCLQANTWNIGGERVWLAPEAFFNYTDATRIIETYAVSPALDPARWTVTATPTGLTLHLVLDMPLAGTHSVIGIRITRNIQPLPDRMGYSQEVTVAQTSGDPLPIVPWLIRQVVPGGEAFMDAVAGASGDTVFGDAPPAAIAPASDQWRVAFSGTGFFKTIYRCESLHDGSISYVSPRASGMRSLTITARMVAAEDYPESLPGAPGKRGHCASLFYDSGQFGAYGEIEIYGHRREEGTGYLEARLALLPIHTNGHWV